MRRSSPLGAVVIAVLAAALVSGGCSRTGEAAPGAQASRERPVRPATADVSSGTSVGVEPTTTAPPATVSVPPTTVAVPPPEFPTFEPSEYGRLIDALDLPGTVSPAQLPAITGDPVADDRIRSLAEQRGYRPRPIAVAALVIVDGAPVQPEVAADLQALLDEARFLGMTVGVTSAHRSPERQRQIFLRELDESAFALRGRAVEPAEIAAGTADDVVLAVLEYHSVPAYSRHHSGHTVDLDAGGSLGEFEGSPVERWLRAADFANAKRFGFVPSYPRGSEPQGPNPEPWEFVHVGTGAIRCAALHVPLADQDAARSCPLLEG